MISINSYTLSSHESIWLINPKHTVCDVNAVNILRFGFTYTRAAYELAKIANGTKAVYFVYLWLIYRLSKHLPFTSNVYKPLQRIKPFPGGWPIGLVYPWHNSRFFNIKFELLTRKHWNTTINHRSRVFINTHTHYCH